MTNSEFKAADVSRARRPVPWLRWVLYAAVTAIILYFLWICSKNPNFEWGVVAQYFTHDSILHGIKMTLGLTVVSMVIGTVLGLICALGKLSGSRFFNTLSNIYLWFFRSTPLLVQLLFWYNLAALFPEVTLPGMGAVSTNTLITPLSAAIIGLSLNEGAFMGEIIRAGLLSVDPNQKETAGLWHEPPSDHVPDSDSSGDDRHYSADRKPGDLHGESDRHGVHHRDG